MTQINQYLDTFRDDLMRLAAFYVGDNANPAAIVFLLRGI